MKNARFIALAEQLLESKQRQVLKQILESKAKRSLRSESDVSLDDELEDLGEEYEGAGATDAARKADDPDKAQVPLGAADDDQLHLNEEDDAQLDIDHLETDERDGDDLVSEEDELEFFETSGEGEEMQPHVKVDDQDKPVIESSDEDEFEDFLEEEGCDDEDLFAEEFGDEDEEALMEARRKKAKAVAKKRR